MNFTERFFLFLHGQIRFIELLDSVLHYLLPSWNYSAGSFKDLEVCLFSLFCVDQFEASTSPRGPPFPWDLPSLGDPSPQTTRFLPERPPSFPSDPFPLVFKLLKIGAFKFPPFFPPPRNNYVQMPHLIFL